MKRKVGEIVDAYFAYTTDNVINEDRQMDVALAFKISKNLAELKRVYEHLLMTRINPIRNQFNWDSNLGDGGLEQAEQEAYDIQYQPLLQEDIEVDFLVIYLDELDFEVTLNEMRVLSIMMEFKEDEQSTAI